MAEIDVTDLFTDPDFNDVMTVVTRFPTVDGLGQVSFREVTDLSVGCVQPASGATIAKLPEEFRVANVRSFWFRGKIETTSTGKYSSIIIFQGQRYQVQVVFPWSNWGEGYTEGTCVAEVPS